MLSLLIVDDEPSVRYAFERTFGDEYRIFAAENGRQGLAKVAECRPEIVLMDIRMPEMNGLEALQRLKAEHPELPVILMTAFSETAQAMEAMRHGAFDYITKPFDNRELREILGKAGDSVRLRGAVKACAVGSPEDDGESIVGRSPQIIQVCKTIGQVARAELPVLITGETGVGKDLVARAIYQYSRRTQAPFMVVNCASLPENLIESELFGFEAGAFTGALKPRVGRFEQCHGGTLFLDEIGELPLTAQAKVLRVLQDGTFERLGSNRTLRADVRIIAATNRNLARLVQEGLFRHDLYHRLSVFSVPVPPLRDRIEDLAPLVDYFLKQFGGQVSPPVTGIAEAALRKLQNHPWPGNVRELQNLIRRAVVVARTPFILPADCVFDSAIGGAGPREPSLQELIEQTIRRGEGEPFQQVITEVEKLLVHKALEMCRNNQAQAARLLGINRMTLRKKMALYSRS